MSILVLSNNRHLIESVRSMSVRFGLGSVGSAAHEGDLKNWCSQPVQGPTRIFLMDGDLDSPSTLDELMRPHVQKSAPLTVKGWIESSRRDPAPDDGTSFQFSIRRPIGAEGLKHSLYWATRDAQKKRTKWLYYTRSVEPSIPAHPLVHRVDATLLESLIQKESQLIAGILVEPREMTESHLGLLRRVTKNPIGSLVPIIGLGNSPDDTFPLRTLARFFVGPPTDTATFNQLIDSFTPALENAFELRIALQVFRKAIKEKDFKTSKRSLRQMVALAPQSFEVAQAAGDYYRLKGSKAEAITWLESALSLNPCHPGLYVTLLDLLPARSEKAKALAEAALRYCPRANNIFTRAQTILGILPTHELPHQRVV